MNTVIWNSVHFILVVTIGMVKKKILRLVESLSANQFLSSRAY